MPPAPLVISLLQAFKGLCEFQLDAEFCMEHVEDRLQVLVSKHLYIYMYIYMHRHFLWVLCIFYDFHFVSLLVPVSGFNIIFMH